MNLPHVLLHIAAAVALAGVVCRLYSISRVTVGWKDRVRWNSWVAAHVMLGLGMVSRLFGLEMAAAYFVTFGIALYFGVRWRRRASDQ